MEQTQLDNPVHLTITQIEEKETKTKQPILVVHFKTLSESENFELAQLFFKPHTRNTEQTNKELVNSLVRFCQCFGISVNHPSEIQEWVGKTGRAHLEYSPGLVGENVYSVKEFISRDLVFPRFTDENSFRGDRLI